MKKGTGVDKPTLSHLFDYVSCKECIIKYKCNAKDQPDRDGCHFGVKENK